MTNLKTQILDISRQNQQNDLTIWFDRMLDIFIKEGIFHDIDELIIINDKIISNLADYRTQTGVGTAVLGMSGGVDSALTASLLKKAGWKVIGVTLPIHQNPEETARGVEAIESLGLHPLHVDLLVVDEASMIDLPLMARLLAALPATTRLILIGDKHQLASVEAGSVFADITGARA